MHKLGINCIAVNPHPLLPEPVASHADLQLCHLGGDEIVAAFGNRKLAEQLSGYGFKVSVSSPLAAEYPGDAMLDCAIIKDRCFGNSRAIDPAVNNGCKKQKIELVPVRQGYAKCSVCIVDEDSIITSDASIAKAAGKAGMDVLVIRGGHIMLKGYDTGFIGGCSGLLDKNRIAFTGSLRHHPDGARIRTFLHSKKIDCLELTDGPLADVGSILPLMEKY